MVDLNGLNENQREAVDWQNGALLVLAGPGSGKTKVLTMRIAKILEESTGQHFHVLGLTFTNKAAGEMSERVERLIPGELPRVRLTTFHSYAAEILQQHGNHVGIKPDFRILSNDNERIAVLQDVLNDLRREQSIVFPDGFVPERILPVINKLLEKCVPVDDVRNILALKRIPESALLATVYINYRVYLKRQNSLDFPSLIIEALELLRKYPGISKFIRRVYKHILVDEFQDTNKSQYELLSLIVKPDPSTLFVVADDDQIIYQWNGASPKRLQDLRDDFKVSEIQLPENYRCPSSVIQLANRLIANNQNRTNKKPLKAMKKVEEDTNTVRLQEFSDFEDEVAWIINDISGRSIIERQKCAILARTKKILDEVYEKCQSIGLKIYMGVRKDEFQSPPLRLLHSILKLANVRNDKALFLVAANSFKAITGVDVDVSKIYAQIDAADCDLLHTWCEDAIMTNGISDVARIFCEQGLVPFLAKFQYEKFADYVFRWYEAFVSQGAGNEKDAIYEEEKEAWRSLVLEIKRQFSGEDLSLYQFLQQLDLRSKTLPKSPDAIPCFTIHASKGMEFGHVYLMGMVDDQLPSWAAVRKGPLSAEVQEERRDCFVAITRAQESLTLTYSHRMWGWNKQPSRFLGEMGFEDVVSE